MAEQTHFVSEGHTGPQPGDEEVDLYYHHLDAMEARFLGRTGVGGQMREVQEQTATGEVAFGD